MKIGMVLAIMFLSLFAQGYVSSNYEKYRRIGASRNLTGAQVAKMILEANGIHDVRITESRGGVLSDHFDPSTKTVALSNDVYHNTSIASIAVAAHEVGHAIQYDQNYAGVKIRTSLLKPTMVASQLSGIFIMIGIIFMESAALGFLFDIGLLMVAIVALFQIATLPVEFDASNRALKNIQAMSIVDETEYDGAKKMLTSAALTYVAAALTAIFNFIRLASMRNNDRRN